MKTCNFCNNWLDQPAPSGESICDECLAEQGAIKQPASNRASTVEQARAKQFAALVKHGGAALFANGLYYAQTIYSLNKFHQRENRLEQIAENYSIKSSEVMKGWLSAFREMRGDPLLLVFCPSWAFWADEYQPSDFHIGQAAAYRAIHKS